MRKATSAIKIDGIVDEQAWQDADSASDFYMILPMDTSFAKVRTDVKMTYDQQNIYLLVINYNGAPGPYMVESLRRDFAFLKNDNFLLFMDPFDDQTNGFSFGANAAGAQWDGLMYDGGKVDLSWDNKWRSVVKNYPDRWVFEAVIPFKTIRYKKGITRWGINFGRNDLKTTEKSSWAPVPRQFPSASLAYTGSLVWDVPPPDPGTNISLIPYVLGGLNKDYTNGKPEKWRGDAGLDAKIAVTSSLNLDLTVNPDFSQVDVDKQVTNLDRFELFFPERRQFFLENGDQFTNFGYATIRPFFSRRIGLGVPIHFGARLSGKLDKNWRLGLMNMQTGSQSETALPAQNFTVAALQRKVFARSNFGFIFINKESINYDPDKVEAGDPVYSRFNRNFGLEYNLASANNFWTGKAMLLKSFSPGTSGKDWVHAANLQYTSRTWNVGWQHEYVGSNYKAEVGYVPRTGYIKFAPQVTRLFFPKSGPLLSHGPQLTTTNFFTEKMDRTDNELMLNYGLVFRARNTLNVWASTTYIKLLQPFDPLNYNVHTLATGTEHSWSTVGADYVSKPQSLFTYSLSARYGGYYADGQRLTLGGEFGYRFQPYVSIALSSTYNNLQLPKPWGNEDFWLVGPRLDVTMTNTLFFTGFMQYNEQLKNINLNTRFQWRYRPASDLFIVYTDNYLPEPYYVKNRALVVKLVYWLNL
ncbi:carbohydrate binding family 9 domain-containing protein [Chitinophaga barathri]|uniref:Hydrolase n=1 Tax=Chitinophaga barathri TaxID=1647451 RepID=A0A3N4N2G4_9BACT|nr:carbohydrate binding family 9 domain-containing protein [Chitinophaga barathri]RPD41823.1 hydrolase [Chitinophaga barathri]